MIHTLRSLSLIMAGFLLPFSALAQVPTIQDCLGAIPICQPIYTEDKVASGFGNYTDEIDRNISCLAHEENAIWYTFTVNETGNFGFILTPNDLQDDYDWALYDLTTASCEEIRTNPDLLVSCNAAGQQGNDMSCVGVTGATGDSDYRIQGGGCHHDPPTISSGNNPVNALVPVQKGNVYVLVVSNWSRSTNGYTIDFGVSAGIGIFDLEDPEVTNATFPQQCGDNSIEIEFNEPIQCATIDAFNFVLEGPGGSYDVRLLSPVCDLGGLYTKSFDLLIEPAITTSGSFTLRLDGDRSTEVLDLCNNPAFNTALTFDISVEEEMEIELGNDITTCPNTTVELDATVDSPTATYLWNTGDVSPIINVIEEGVYAVTVTDGCRMGSDIITVMHNAGNNLAINLGEDRTVCEGDNVILDVTNLGANYLWSTGSTSPILTISTSGTYAVTVTDDCASVQDEVAITFTESPSIELGEDQLLCPDETIQLNVALNNAAYEWQDGSTNSNFTVTQSGIYAVTVTTNCGEISDEVQVDYESPLSLNLGQDRTLCEGETIFLEASQPNATYEWQDGSTLPTLEVVSEGQYAVTVSNACETVSDEITINLIANFELELGEDVVMCEGETVDLIVTLENVDIQWQDNSKSPIYTVQETGDYWVIATNDCFQHKDSVAVTLNAAPEINLGADRTLCPNDTILLGTPPKNVSYKWQDGSAVAQYEVSAAGYYTLTVTNDCGIAMDGVIVEQTEPLIINLGQDTVICKGSSLTLKPKTNAKDYKWQDGSSTASFEATEAGYYFVEVSNDCEMLMDDIEIEWCDRCEVYIPNVFSPNEDDKNDLFRPFPNCDFLAYSLQIFDRWGTLIFQTEELQQGWDGSIENELASNGVYVWRVTYTVEENGKQRKVSEAGEVTLLR